ncbi:MAG: phasin family protein [Xanthobacteraceae bacterium]
MSRSGWLALRARDLQEVMTLQADYITRQMQLFTEQARELGESTNKAAKDAATPRHWVPDCCRRAVG